MRESSYEVCFDSDQTVASYGIEVPRWISPTIRASQVAALDGIDGCDSGAYMPAVTYGDALATMNEHGDEVMAFLDEHGGADLGADFIGLSWGGMAVYIVSQAVESWARLVIDDLAERIEAAR